MAYIGNSPANVGNYQIVDDISSSFDGNETSFALASGSVTITPAKSGQILASINGVMQEPDDTGTNGFKVSGSNIVFSSAPASGDTFWAVYQGQEVDIGTPSDGVVDTVHIKDNAITAAKIADGTVVAADIANDAVTNAKMADDAVGIAELSATGTASSSTFLRGDNSWVSALPLAGGTMTGNILHNDSVKGIYGTGSDLQIYHVADEHSYIKDTGSGDLRIMATNLSLRSDSTNEPFINCIEDGAVTLYHNNLAKIATTSTGINVTGSVTADGLHIEGTSGSNPTTTIEHSAYNLEGEPLRLERTDSNDRYHSIRAKHGTNAAENYIAFDLHNFVSGETQTRALRIEGSGDVSFYEDTGTTAKLFWDASAESLGIGTTSPAAPLHIAGNVVIDTGSPDLYFATTSASHTNWRLAAQESVSDAFEIASGTQSASSNAIADTYTARFVVKNTGNVGIGTTSPNEAGYQSGSRVLSIQGAAADDFGVLELLNTNATSANRLGEVTFGNMDGGGSVVCSSRVRARRDGADNSSDLSLWTTSTGTLTERLTIDSSGNVGIGTTSPSFDIGNVGIHIGGNTSPAIRLKSSTTGSADWEIYASSASTGGLGFYEHQNNQTHMYINESGYLGIGVNFITPARALHVKSGAGTAQIQSTASTSTLYLGDAASSVIDNQGIGSAGNDITLIAGGYERMRITSSGYVDMAGASDVRLTLGSQGTAGNNDANWIRGNGTSISYNAASANHIWETGGDEKMRLDSHGRLALGGTAVANIMMAIESDGSGANQAGIRFIDSNSGNDHQIYNNGGNLFFRDYTAGQTRMAILENGSVGIGTASPAAKLDISNGSSVAHYQVTQANGNTAKFGIVSGSNIEISGTSNNDIYFKRAGSEKLRITSSGITFNGDTAAANALDDYEEGTWTPVFSDGSNDMTMNATYGGSYTRIGNTVFITAFAVATAEGSPTGAIAVYGLPFTVANTNDDYAAISIGYGNELNITAGHAVTGYIQINQTYIPLVVWDSTAGCTAMSKEEISSDGQLIFHGQYRVA